MRTSKNIEIVSNDCMNLGCRNLNITDISVVDAPGKMISLGT